MEEISLLSILYRTKIINLIVPYRIKDSKYREWDKSLNGKKSLLYVNLYKEKALFKCSYFAQQLM
jgi:hypothetical protein